MEIIANTMTTRKNELKTIEDIKSINGRNKL